MGNRAVITTMPKDGKKIDKQIGIYIHWFTDIDDLQRILNKCKEEGFREPNEDSYGWASLVYMLINELYTFKYEGFGIGIDVCKHLDCDNGDEGVILIDGWKIVGRMYG
jgi:hypothetical protein